MGRKIKTNSGAVPFPVVHTFKLTGSSSTVSQYELIKIIGESPKLSKYISISRNRNFVKSEPEYYLSKKEVGDWPLLIGLHKTNIVEVLIGYREEEDLNVNTLLVRFNNQDMTVTIYYFEKDYSTDLIQLLPFMKKLYKRG
ncbi:hypothetical protein [Arenibacter certesii]|uniref:Uncharacterized protein n=1 Tax=Arenibacter certesii TaxID=228955 RepID=A0A918IYZ5_9FLAO|nr:hypothetical protein [Arenibacter certesii]GGW37271.1 hypothetical protein GCM10007383_22660 [Arenibacter certesii]